MRKNKVRRGLVAIILVVIALFFIAGTYARYSTTANANATVGVANWNVAIKKGNTTLNSTTQNVNFTVANNDYVVSNKVAPATSATAQFELDLTGTEVAVDFVATVDTTNLPANAQIQVTATDDQLSGYTSGNTITYTLPNGAAFTSENGVKNITITLTWANSDSNNAADTALGIAGGTISVPVTFTAQQHIAN